MANAISAPQSAQVNPPSGGNGGDIEAPSHRSGRVAPLEMAETRAVARGVQNDTPNRGSALAQAAALLAVGSGMLTGGVFALQNHKNMTRQNGHDMPDAASIGGAVLILGLGTMFALASIPAMIDSFRGQN